MLVIAMVVMVSVVILMVVMVMVVEIMIEKWGLMECIQHEKCISFSSSILYMVTLG
jgi:hypothetical protein